MPSTGGWWADLGAGEGAFTLALAELLAPGARITAIDKDAGALRRLAGEMGRRYPDTRLEVLRADFSRPLALAGFDGVLMANSLHFLRVKRPVLQQVKEVLRPGGRLVIVEYGADRGNPWVPHPFSYASWETMAAEAGYTGTRFLKSVPSRFLGSMYSSVTERPA